MKEGKETNRSGTEDDNSIAFFNPAAQRSGDGHFYLSRTEPENTIEVLLLQSFDQTRKTFTSDWEQEKFKATSIVFSGYRPR